MGREEHLHCEAHENDDDGGATNRNEAAGVREAVFASVRWYIGPPIV